MTIETISLNRSHGGMQGVYKHNSRETGTGMTFSVYVPPNAAEVKLPVVWYLSGLTCTHANVMEKGEYRRVAAELGLVIVCPDTSPRGEGVPNDEAYDFGQGAGFYVNGDKRPGVATTRRVSFTCGRRRRSPRTSPRSPTEESGEVTPWASTARRRMLSGLSRLVHRGKH